MKSFDVLVLGGGTAGTAAAKAAATVGARVAMFNAGELGGLCILRGCMPTKTMLHAAHLVHQAERHHTPGIGHAIPSIDFTAVMANKDAKVKRFKDAKIRGIESGGYEVIDAYARFTGPDTVEADGVTYGFAKGAVLATGSIPTIPPIPGIEKVTVWDSDDVMALTELPESVIVMGSGAIGLELALFLARMGSRVTQVSRSPILSKLDPVLTEEMERIIDAEPNLELVSRFKATGIAERDGEVHLHLETDKGARTVSALRFVAATGRHVKLEGMGLAAAGVETDRGHVVHDVCMRTSNPNIFVAGDATGCLQLLHVANWEGTSAGLGAARAPGEHPVERRLRMGVVFTDPPLSIVGMTESEATAAGLPVVTAHARFAETGRAITMDVQHGVWKLVAHKDTGEILGTQILGPRADDIGHVISTVMYYHGTVNDLLKMPWYHPTVTEVLLSLARELAEQTV